MRITHRRKAGPNSVRRAAATFAAALSASRLSVSRSRARARSGSELLDLAADLTAALRARVSGDDGDEPVDARVLCRMLCEEMSARRGGRRIDLRFERFPDEIEVTGLWLEFPDFDLVIVEERAEAVQQLVILGHELWHLHAGHCHRQMTGAAAAARALADQPGWRKLALTVAARNGSHEAEERQAEDFGHRLAADFRTWLDGSDRLAPTDPVGRAVQVSRGYRRPHSAAPLQNIEPLSLALRRPADIEAVRAHATKASRSVAAHE